MQQGVVWEEIRDGNGGKRGGGNMGVRDKGSRKTGWCWELEDCRMLRFEMDITSEGRTECISCISSVLP